MSTQHTDDISTWRVAGGHARLTPVRVASLLALSLAIIVALAACEIDESSSASAQETLNVVIPPCIPFPGSDVDPCERRASWEPLNAHNVEYEMVFPQPAPTIEDSYMRLDDEVAASAIQFVVRAIPIPGTTRCATFDSFPNSYSFHIDEATSELIEYTHCWVDLAVNEYIVGVGPARLTIDIGVWTGNYTGERLKVEARIYGDKIEGREWIHYIAGPGEPTNASWRMYWQQDVQRREDGTVVIVNWEKQFYDAISPPEFAEINASRTEVPLSDYRQEIKRAHAKYYEKTGGRIGSGVDYYGNALPFAATEATEAALLNYIGQIRAVDGVEFASYSPPPAPSENGPIPDALSISDIIATRVAGGQAR